MNRCCHLLILLIGGRLPAIADSTISPNAKFAYSANSGWINFRPDDSTSNGVIFTEYFLSGRAYAANIGWIDFGSGAPVNGVRYQNNFSDFGVNHDGRGNLSGFAYSANTGWINFGWASATDGNRPKVNLETGVITGYAYSGNLGWIDLGTGLSTHMQTVDSDADGISDSWELSIFGGLNTASATSDFDNDGATDHNEYVAATSPTDAGSLLQISSATYNGAFTAATIVFNTHPSRFYSLQTTEALGPPTVWEESALGTFAPDPGATTTRTISWTGSAQKLIRVVAIKPLQP